ncbi:DoxX family protein [Leucobacter tardus]|uniref:DoxX family protein n=1 Tax=Leucobacter tardus TaxID=501483 RepID=A0A939QAU6_9MICO|nr:DoxX family protein [Leucobacter tardus]MBO2988835.1 DoxX family protein [Leucobacter tardus]
MTLLNPSARTPILRDLALLVARVALGVILIAHGWQKFSEWTIAGTQESFAGMGIPLPQVSAAFVAGAELIGGIALVIGLLTPLAALLNLIAQVGAIVLVHASAGIFVVDGGFELVLAIAAGLFVLLLAGGGRFSVDRLFSRSVALPAK